MTFFIFFVVGKRYEAPAALQDLPAQQEAEGVPGVARGRTLPYCRGGRSSYC